MELSQLLLLASLALSAVTTLPGLKAIAKRSRTNSQPNRSGYEDRDGKSTLEDARAFSNTTPKAFVLASSLIGLAASIAVAVLSGSLLRSATHLGAVVRNCIPVASWILFTLQALCLFMSRDSVQAYNLAAWLASAALGWGTALLAAVTLDPFWSPSRTVSAAEAVESVAIVVLICASVSLPRRPPVTHNGHAVDDMLTTSMIDRMTWSWAWGLPMFVKGKSVIDFDDMPLLPHWVRARDTAERWRRAAAGAITMAPTWRLMAWVYHREAALQWSLGIVRGLSSFGVYYTTLEVLRIIETLPGRADLPRRTWFLVAWMCIFIIAGEWLEQYVHWIGWGELNNYVRAQFPALMFEKLMRRKNVTGAPAKSDSGPVAPSPAGGGRPGNRRDDDEGGGRGGRDGSEDVITTRKAIQHLVANDVRRIAEFCGRQELLILTIGRLVISLVFLVQLLGWTALGAGLLSWAIFLPLGIGATRKSVKSLGEWVKIRDRKQTALDESINGIRQVKFSALETEWERRIGLVREEELTAIWRLALIDMVNFAFWLAGPIILAAVSLAVYAVMNGRLLPSLTFISIMAFRSLETAVSVVPDLVLDLINFVISIRRIDTYLRSPELHDGVVTEGEELAIEHAKIGWPVDDRREDEKDRFVLTDVTITFPKGELSVISGKTGSGKSLLLEALLGEVDLLAGTIRAPRTPSPDERRDDRANLAGSSWILPGAKALVGQTPWIENATVRDNILFGLPMEPIRYQQTLAACALLKDLEILSDGDDTELGVNGVNLSGGQKWRVSLARAIYSRAGILLMDDIFSAVDAHVGKHLLEECLGGSLCRGRTIVVVTHHVDLCLSRARLVVELADGAVKSVRTAGCANGDEDDTTAVNSEVASTRGETEAEAEIEAEVEADKPPKARRKFIHAEMRPAGAVKRNVWLTYLKAAGNRWYLWWAFVMINSVLFQVAVVSRSWWLKIWTSQGEAHDRMTGTALPSTIMVVQGHDLHAAGVIASPGDDSSASDLYFYLVVYLLISLSGIVVAVVRYLYLAIVSLRASRALFRRVLSAVLRAPLLWIDTTPPARILNRLAVDTISVDRILIREIDKITVRTFNLVGVCVAAWFVSIWFILLAAVCMAISLVLSRRHVTCKRPVKRLESVARSPMFAIFGSGLSGIVTIRAYDRTADYIERAYLIIDVYVATSWHLNINNHWMGFCMGVVGSFFTAVVALFVLFKRVDAALAGFALSFAVEFAASALWMIRTFVAVENAMNSMERIVEYSRIDTEPLGGIEPPAAWPTEGRVEVRDLVVGYAPDLPPVLCGVSFQLKGGERVGVVGRTGAGKSSLTLALFRFLEPRSGSIYIDGLDVSAMTLRGLRSRLTIIPQDPLLFSGTIRSNLDPFGRYSDDTLNDALRRVHLVGSETLGGEQQQDENSVFADLSTPISDCGGNLSHGQRQLLCLARAVAERPRIMILDEATSAVDMATDVLIQRSIRDEFARCTLIVIAHRLSTVCDFDRVLVLDGGRVTEFGPPRELWQRSGGSLFRALCDQSGEQEILTRVLGGEGGTIRSANGGG